MNNPSNRSSFSRREVLKSAAALSTTAALGSLLGSPSATRAQTFPTSAPAILGKADHSYELIDNWAHLPGHIAFGNTHSVVETADRRIIVHHTGHESVCFFDADGKFIESWGKEYFGAAHGMDLHVEDGQEFLYLALTSQHRMVKTDLKGNVVFSLDYPKDAVDFTGKPCYEKRDQYVPTYTAFAPNGDFYITDGYGAGFIHHYDKTGKYLNSFAGKGDLPEQTRCPHGIFCDTRDPQNPRLVVADREHHRLQYFTLDGKLDHLVANETPKQTHDDAGRLRRPCQFSQRGSELLVPDLRGRVTILDKNNDVIVHLGDNPNVKQRANNNVPKTDLTPGQFCCPHGATWDRDGNIYVAEWLPYGRVTKLRKV